MSKKDTLLSTIGYLETGTEYIRRYETKEINLDFALISIELAIRKARKNLEWLALTEKDG